MPHTPQWFPTPTPKGKLSTFTPPPCPISGYSRTIHKWRPINHRSQLVRLSDMGAHEQARTCALANRPTTWALIATGGHAHAVQPSSPHHDPLRYTAENCHKASGPYLRSISATFCLSRRIALSSHPESTNASASTLRAIAKTWDPGGNFFPHRTRISLRNLMASS